MSLSNIRASRKRSSLSQLSFINIEIIKNYLSTNLLPCGWKSPALLDEGNSSCTKGCSAEWESSTQNRCTARRTTSAMQTKPKHRPTRALGIACHAPELASSSQQRIRKYQCTAASQSSSSTSMAPPANTCSRNLQDIRTSVTETP